MIGNRNYLTFRMSPTPRLTAILNRKSFAKSLLGFEPDSFGQNAIALPLAPAPPRTYKLMDIESTTVRDSAPYEDVIVVGQLQHRPNVIEPWSANVTNAASHLRCERKKEKDK